MHIRLTMKAVKVGFMLMLIAVLALSNACAQTPDKYNPARWMEDTFYPEKAGYTLKDIVLPGAHDAGMSVLTAVGGQQKGTINECNTLTQIQNIKGQLNDGIRMFDLRVGMYDNALYIKHCSADCMEDAIGGGYGEKLKTILVDIKNFIYANRKETVMLTFSHFCEREAPAAQTAQFIIETLGNSLVFNNDGKKLNQIKLRDVAGKVVVVFEQYARADKLIDSCSIAPSSGSFINFRREYAATNKLDLLQKREATFFAGLGSSKLRDNDLVRLDWQLTQSSEEAAMVCNDFQDENISPVVNSVLFLTNVLTKHRSIKSLAAMGNKQMQQLCDKWIANGTINKNNKPNILYVDVAGKWITDYCVQLNKTALYKND
jgi:hypothetical protein